MQAEEIARLIQSEFPTAEVDVASDDGTHFHATVVTEAFAGVRSVERHQMIYRSLGERMGREIHALSIRALTPEEMAAGRP